MTNEAGWIFWVEHDGIIRNFTVGEENEDTAKLAIQRENPGVNFLNFVSKQRAPADLIEFLKLSGGKVMEWKPVTASDKLTPRGSDIHSSYDPLRKK